MTSGSSILENAAYLMGVDGVTARAVHAGGLTLHCYFAGQGPPLLLLHGHGGAATIWRRNIAALAERWSIYAPDLPGHGLSARQEADYTLKAASEIVLRLMDAEGLGKVHVVGQSLGGMISLRLALDHPERVGKLALVGIPGLGKEIAMPLRLAALPLVPKFFSRPSRSRLYGFYRTYFFHDPSLATADFIDRSYFYRTIPGSARGLLKMIRQGVSLKGQRNNHNLTSELPRLAAPTLLIWGAQDRIIPVAHAHAASRLIPNCRLETIERCGHCPPYERPEEFNRLVLEFLGE